MRGMGSVRAGTAHANIQKNKHSWILGNGCKRGCGTQVERVNWDKTTKGLHYQDAPLETLESNQEKEGTCWVWKVWENGGRDTV